MRTILNNLRILPIFNFVKYNPLMTDLKQQSKALLLSKNISITNPRISVLNLLLNAQQPLTIDQLFKLSNGDLAQSTLYRILADFKKFDLVVEFVTPDNSTVVELKHKDFGHHHHIFCEKCDQIIDVELNHKFEKELSKEVSKIEKRYSISIREHSLELLGLCKSCNSEKHN